MVDSYVGPYKIIREIAEGSIGQVFEAVDQTRQKKVAITYLRADAARRPEIEPRLYSEAKTLAQLNHPHIARLFGFVRREDRLYLVMEFVEGETLEAVLKREGRLQPNVALAFFHQTMSAVGFAHRLGVIHGDLRPSKIMVTNFGLIKILDFAIAPILGSPDRASPRNGNVRYISPEQIRGDSADARSDIYSLGVLLYELIVGNVPYDSDSDEVILRAQIEARPLRASLLVPNSPKWLDAFLLRALAESPANRFQSVAAMARAMEVQIKAPVASAAPKQRNVWRQRWARWASAASNSTWIAGNQMLASLNAITTSAAKISGQTPAFRTGVKNLGIEAKSRLLRMTRLFVWRQNCVGLFMAAFTTVKNIGRVIYVSSSHSHRPSTEAKNSMAWTKRAALWRWDAKPQFESLKAYLASNFELGWNRYALLTLLVVSLTLEVFVFRGANLLLAHNYMLRPRTSLNDAVDAMFIQIRQDPITVAAANNTKEPETMVVAPIAARPPAPEQNARPKMPEPQLSRPPRSKNQSGAPQTAINTARESSSLFTTAPEKQTVLAAVKEPSVSEPIRPTANVGNNPAKVQLNIKWEN